MATGKAHALRRLRACHTHRGPCWSCHPAGFYTIDLDEQDFKSPEEIRKANLRGVDLRGARIDGVDFHLVDLRDALYDSDQAELLRRAGAILKSKAR